LYKHIDLKRIEYIIHLKQGEPNVQMRFTPSGGLAKLMFLPKGRNIRQAIDCISAITVSNIFKIIFCGSIY